ncbi:MAG: hypothetical protein AAFS01_08105 [Pseudomonadota bacterium]
MTNLKMPKPRDFGWTLKPTSSSLFDIQKRDNGQFSVVLNHALLRGVSAEMVHWWFCNFTHLKVRLHGVPDYEGQQVPAYWLWHPIDHYSAELSGTLGPGNTAQPGCAIRIREAMQYDRYGWKYKADAKLKVLYVGKDGWAMGKVLPLFGPVIMLRIHYKDVFDDGQHIGVHYHYEVVIGSSAKTSLGRWVNSRITGAYGTEFFDAWHRHNVIEVGTFENFLPALFAQRSTPESLEYQPDMAPDLPPSEIQEGFDRSFFEGRVKAYSSGSNPYAVQRFDGPSIL